MLRVIEYIGLFIAVVVLQEFLFNNIQISVLVNPYIYVAFILLLPMETPGWSLLLLAFGLGIVIDFTSGTPGIHTIATVASAFSRPYLLTLFAGKDSVNDGGVPSSVRLGVRKYMAYSTVLVLLHSSVLFTVETLNLSLYFHTFLRILISTALTSLLIFFGQLAIFRVKKT